MVMLVRMRSRDPGRGTVLRFVFDFILFRYNVLIIIIINVTIALFSVDRHRLQYFCEYIMLLTLAYCPACKGPTINVEWSTYRQPKYLSFDLDITLATQRLLDDSSTVNFLNARNRSWREALLASY